MKKLLIYIICIACSLELTAQTATPTTADTLTSAEPATLAHFISTGLQNNYRLRIVRNEERLAESNATRANAGMLPSVTASAGYGGALNSSNTTARGTGETSRSRNVLNHTLHAGIIAEWTIFDGFKIQTNYQRLQELRRQSATQTRVAIEDYVAELTSEYYNFIRQRLRIVLERYTIGSASRLDLQQAQVDFNADSALSLKQHEVLASSLIRLYDLMAIKDMSKRFTVADTAIDVDTHLLLDTLWSTTLRTNANLLNAAHNRTLSEIDLRSVRSRDYPYVKLNAAYGYTHNNYGSGNTVKRHNWGLDFGVTVGYKIFDGNRRRERRNAEINLENAELARQEIEHSLRADLADLWQAYKNNLRLLALERENLITAKENHYIACERFMLGNLSGIEMREAQQNLLDAEERILDAEFNTKLCEISLRQISGGIMHYAK
ncbi:MAG: TolC family protein [Bacteroidaceae bacterium]|nr:TolC family protein [Bacteroidaceae bacterium]